MIDSIQLVSMLAGGLSSLLAVGAREIYGRYRARQKLQSALEAEFRNALASDSLKVLGAYLDNAVGQFSVAEYANDAHVRRRVNMFLARVEEFVGKTGEVPASDTVEPPVNGDKAWIQATPDGELDEIEQRVLSGAVWDGLAHLRRVIEQRLRGIAQEHGLAVPERPGAKRLVEVLRRHELGNEEDWTRLRYVIDACNRAVHGLDVSTSEAVEAVRLAQRVLQALPITEQQTPR